MLFRVSHQPERSRHMPPDTKTALLNCAERAARSRGFDGFSYADLAANVGIRKASIHHHFPTKAMLALSLIQRYHQTMLTACADIDGRGGTAAQRLASLIAIYRDAAGEGESLCLCVSFSTSPASLSPEVIAGLADFRRMIIDWISKVFELANGDHSIVSLDDPLEEAQAVLPLLEGAQLAARIEMNAAVYDKAVALLTKRLR